MADQSKTLIDLDAADEEAQAVAARLQRTGFLPIQTNWFDRLFISIYIAWHHGQVMQELVHQNEKIVEAESLPYLQIDTSTLETDLETPALRLTVQNQGVGPARIAEERARCAHDRVRSRCRRQPAHRRCSRGSARGDFRDRGALCL